MTERNNLNNKSNSLMASEEMGDVEYTWTFQDLIEKSPLFELGFSPKHIYYQRESNVPKDRVTNIPAAHYPSEATLGYFERQAENPDLSYIGRNVHREAAQAIKKGEIPEGDFVFMKDFMLPGDRTISYPGTESQPPPIATSGLDKADELSTHMHEFIHRALDTVPQLKKWKEENKIDSGEEEVLMGAFVSKYFPEMSNLEIDRVKGMYGVDLTEDYNKKKVSKWINEVETIAKDILKETTPPSLMDRAQTSAAKHAEGYQYRPEDKLSLIDKIKQAFRM